jgi:alpha-tubulin suppressor-like RCC1 family protein
MCAVGFTLVACGARSAPDLTVNPWGDEGETAVELRGCFTKIAAKGGSACALRTDGTLFCWGNNTRGQLGMITTKPVIGPTRIETLKNVRDVSLGGEFGCALTAEGLRCYGHNNFGQVGAGDTGAARLPIVVDGLSPELRAFSAGGTHACAAAADGKLYCWGNNGWGELGLGFASGSDTSFSVNRPASVDLVGATLLAAGEVHTCAAAGSVALYCWGGRASEPSYPSPGPPSPVFLTAVVPPMRKLAAGNEFACLITQDGTLVCWGANGYVTSGDGKLAPIAGLSATTVDVACGWGHACVATRAGAVLCWGMNQRGALGRDPSVGDNPDRVPRQVAGIDGHAIGVAVGTDFSCALTAEGEVWCWGSQDFAQLGVVSEHPMDSATPRRVALQCP